MIRARLQVARGRLPAGARNARAAWTERAALWLALEDEAGHVGYGEAAPLPGYSDETFEAARTALEAFAAALAGRPANVATGAAAAAVREAADASTGRAEGPELGVGPTSSRAAVAQRALRGLLGVERGPWGPPSARFAVGAALLELLAARLGAAVADLVVARPAGLHPPATAKAQVEAAAWPAPRRRGHVRAGGASDLAGRDELRAGPEGAPRTSPARGAKPRAPVEAAVIDSGRDEGLRPPPGAGAEGAVDDGPAQSVGLQGLLTGPPGPGWASTARRASADGYAAVKVKVGRPEAFEAEIAALGAVKAALPSGVELRVDVNQAFEREGLEARLLALASVGVDLVEEPAALEAVEALEGSPVPLALDESLRAPGAAARAEALARRGLVSAFVLKPAVLGGLWATLDGVARARAVGARVSLSHLFDGPIAHRTYAALALAVGGEGPHGLAPHPGLEALGGPSPWPVRGGRLWADDAPPLDGGWW